MRKMLGAAQKSTLGELSRSPSPTPHSLFLSLRLRESLLHRPHSRSLSSSSSSFFPISLSSLYSLMVFLHSIATATAATAIATAAATVTAATTATVAPRYSDIGIACCSASSLSVSFDPLNLAGGRPAISRKLVKSRTYRVKEKGGLSSFPELLQTFLSFPHCLAARFSLEPARTRIEAVDPRLNNKGYTPQSRYS